MGQKRKSETKLVFQKGRQYLRDLAIYCTSRKIYSCLFTPCYRTPMLKKAEGDLCLKADKIYFDQKGELRKEQYAELVSYLKKEVSSLSENEKGELEGIYVIEVADDDPIPINIILMPMNLRVPNPKVKEAIEIQFL